jgi:hypothetical protein
MSKQAPAQNFPTECNDASSFGHPADPANLNDSISVSVGR